MYYKIVLNFQVNESSTNPPTVVMSKSNLKPLKGWLEYENFTVNFTIALLNIGGSVKYILHSHIL